jgi:hypothetical protein
MVDHAARTSIADAKPSRALHLTSTALCVLSLCKTLYSVRLCSCSHSARYSVRALNASPMRIARLRQAPFTPDVKNTPSLPAPHLPLEYHRASFASFQVPLRGTQVPGQGARSCTCPMHICRILACFRTVGSRRSAVVSQGYITRSIEPAHAISTCCLHLFPSATGRPKWIPTQWAHLYPCALGHTG